MLGGEGFEVTQQELRDAVLDRYGDALTPDQVDAIAGGIWYDLGGGIHPGDQPGLPQGGFEAAAAASV